MVDPACPDLFDYFLPKLRCPACHSGALGFRPDPCGIVMWRCSMCGVGARPPLPPHLTGANPSDPVEGEVYMLRGYRVEVIGRPDDEEFGAKAGSYDEYSPAGQRVRCVTSILDWTFMLSGGITE